MNVKDVLCLCVDAVTVVLYNTMKALSELTEIPVTQVQHFQNINFVFYFSCLLYTSLSA